jgi:hypothetical protein
MDDATKRITYYGDAARVGALVQMLERQGVQVDWSPPHEERGLASDINEVIVNLVSTGSALAIAAGVKQFRQRFPRHKIEVEGEKEDDGND